MEVGRVAIAAGRLDAALGALWWHLAPDLVAEEVARKAPAGRVRDNIRQLTQSRLDTTHSDPLLAFVDEVEAAQEQRNEVLHARWLLRGDDAMRPVGEFLTLDPSEQAAYLEDWEREAKASTGWRQQPNRSLTLTDPHRLEQLRQLERRLSSAEEVAIRWHYQIASMRQCGTPKGWKGPPEARIGPQPLPPGALTGPAAEEALRGFLRRQEGNRGGATA